MAGDIKGITIEIDGSTTKLQKALSDVNKTSWKLSTELKTINQALKFNPGNSELIAQKQRVLAESVDNTKDKLKQLKEAHKQASGQLERGEIGKDEFDALSREIIKAESQLKYYNAEMKKLDPAKIDRIAEGFEKAGSKTKAAGENLTKGVTVPILAIGAASIAAFNEVDNGLDIIVKKTGATGDAMAGLEESFNAVYGSMPVSADEVGNAIGELNTQFGLTGPALEDATKYMLKFAEITDSDVTQATINAKAALEKYGVGVESLPELLDSVAYEGQRTGVSADKLFDSITKGSPQLKAMGLGIKESASLMATFEQKGVDSSKMIGFLARAQTNWAKDGKSMSDGLKELSSDLSKASTEEEKIALAAQHFGIRGGAAMKEALDDLGISLDDLAVAAVDTSGVVENTWDGVQDPIDKVTTAFNNAKLAGKEVGEALQETLVPIIEAAGEKLRELAEWFRNLSPEQKETIVKFGLIAAAVGPFLVILGTLLGAISKIIGFFKLFGGVMALVSGGPVLWIIAAIAAIIAIIALLKMDIGDVTNWISEKFNAIGEFFGNLWSKASEAFGNIIGGAKELASSVPDAIGEAVQAGLDWITGKWEDFKTAGRNIITSIGDGISEGVGWIKEKIGGVASTIRSYLPFSPAKAGPLRDLNKLNFGGTISESILKGRAQIKSAMESALSLGDIQKNFEWVNRPDQLSPAGTTPKNGGESVVNNNNITINNPLPERSSDSVRKTLLKQSYGF